MSLIEISQANPEQLDAYSVRQVVQFAGDGRLLDGSVCSDEFRRYLQTIRSAKIAAYVEQCLAESFADSGLVLQDLVNELGRRLEYSVRNGRHRGLTSQVGFDGIWRSPDKWDLVVEVKTTDAYRLSLDKLAGYRNKLKADNQVSNNSSILIVVGREDTGEVEAQIRGSRHAWDVRLLSAESLGKLVRLKEEAGDDSTAERIRGLLIPHEYTRLDALIDVVFVTAEDIKRPAEESPDEVLQSTNSGQSAEPSHQRTKDSAIEEIRQSLVELFAKKMQKDLLKKSKAQYWSSDKKLRVCCTVSKFYERSDNYWFGYRQAWHEFLEAGEDAYLVLGCVGDGPAFALPHHFMAGLLDKLNTTEPPDGRMYWHLHLAESGKDHFVFRLKGLGQTVSIDQFRLSAQ